MNERDIFLAAIEITDSAERASFLEQACAGNTDLRAQVEELLHTHSEASQFLETPAIAVDSAVDRTALTNGSNSDEGSHGNRTLGESEFRQFLEPATRPGWLGRLQHYEIEQVLGRGAFGIVAKAFDEKLQRVVAIKLMSPELASTSPPRKRFLREARTAAAVTHENLVAIHAVEEKPIPYLVMEYIPGQTLQQQMDGHGPFEILEVLRIGQQLAAGLAAAHAANLVHRDIKPPNILLAEGPIVRVKISDFGLARAVDDASMTRSGMIAGTPMYMAPEQARGETLDHRADLFSLGSVLYQMTCGRPPFRADNTVAVLRRVCDDTPRSLSDVLPGVPVWLEVIIFKLLEKDREHRFQTAQEVANLLARCQRELEHNGKVTCVEIPSETANVQAVCRRKAKKKPIGLVVGGVLATVALFGIVLINRGERSLDPDSSPKNQETATRQVNSLAQEQPIDLLKLLAGSRNFMDRRLKLENGKLLTPEFKYPGAIGSLPLGKLPPEYDVRLQLERISTQGAGFNLGIVVGGRQVLVGMDCGYSPKVWGLDYLDGVPAHREHNETRNPGHRLLVGRASAVTIQVRNNHVIAMCDGETLIDWKGNPQRLSLWKQYKIPRSHSLFFVSQAEFIVHKMELIPYRATVTVEAATSHEWPSDAPPPAIFPFDSSQAEAHQNAWAEYLGIPVEYENSIGMKFRLIPPSEFLMGSTAEEVVAALKLAGKDEALRELIQSETPQHKVVLTQPVYISVTEVTQSQYKQLMGLNPSYFSASGEGKEAVTDLTTANYPVEMVTWNDAAEFCARLSQREKLKPYYFRSGESVTPLDGTGYRLPTEAEWESACRAGTTTWFASGDQEHDLRSVGWFAGNSDGRTHAVGELQANPYGLSDMHGNVWEWVQDGWDPTFYETSGENPVINPSAAFSDSHQLLRGGNWYDDSSSCRSSHRQALHPTFLSGRFGFRVVLVADAVRQLPTKLERTRLAARALLEGGGLLQINGAQQIRSPGDVDAFINESTDVTMVWFENADRDQLDKVFPMISQVGRRIPVIECVGAPVRGTHLKSLAGIEIATLNLDSTDIRDEDVELINELDIRTQLSLADTRITDQGLIQLDTRRLTILNLSNTAVTDASVARVKGVTDLFIASTNITDDAVMQLCVNNPSLARLDLSDTRITDRSLESLGQLPSLVGLWLKDTAVSKESIETFQKSNPGCQIVR